MNCKFPGCDKEAVYHTEKLTLCGRHKVICLTMLQKLYDDGPQTREQLKEAIDQKLNEN